LKTSIANKPLLLSSPLDTQRDHEKLHSHAITRAGLASIAVESLYIHFDMNEFWQKHLLSEGAEFADGRVASFADAPTDARSSKVSLCDLSHYGVIDTTGDEAAAFLHAQLTNDVLTQDDASARWNAWCSPKGRMLVNFLQWRERANESATVSIRLLTPKALQPAIQKRLGMFVLRAKAKISDVSDSLVPIGLAGEDALACANAVVGKSLGYSLAPLDSRSFIYRRIDVRVIALSARRVIFLCPTANAEIARALWQDLRTRAAPAGANAWALAGVRDGIAEITPTSQELFVPQMANLELTGGVSFKKGCYPGQEIVARTQYRGILKRRMVRVRFAPDALPQPGADVFSPVFADQACGSIVNAARAADGSVEALVVAQLDAINADASKALFADAAHRVPMTILALPYNVPELTAQAA
jgi:tRNA-modifying protein YgfZ